MCFLPYGPMSPDIPSPKLKMSIAAVAVCSGNIIRERIVPVRNAIAPIPGCVFRFSCRSNISSSGWIIGSLCLLHRPLKSIENTSSALRLYAFAIL